MLTRRRFVQTVGIGAAGAWPAPGSARAAARTASGRRRADARRRSHRATHHPLEQREPARSRQDGARRRPGRVRPERRGAGPLLERHRAPSSRRSPSTTACKPENITLGCGSTQILRTATHVFTANRQGARRHDSDLRGVRRLRRHDGPPGPRGRARPNFKIDLDRFADARAAPGWSSTATRTTRRRPTSARARRATSSRASTGSRRTPRSSSTRRTSTTSRDPDHDTHIPLAVEDPRIIVARTFSKAYGMAGLRIGYAVGHADTISKMTEWDARLRHELAERAARCTPASRRSQQDASFITTERARNTEVARLHDEVVRRPRHEADRLAGQLHVREHRPPGEGVPRRVPAKGVNVARDFPPFEKTHCRISFGTMDEMQKAVAVFGEVLAKKRRRQRRSGAIFPARRCPDPSS